MNDIRDEIERIFLVLESELHFIQLSILVKDPLLWPFFLQKIQVLENQLQDFVDVIEALEK